MRTPTQQGFKFPAEWEPHEAIFLAWPHDKLTFPEMEKVEHAYLGIIEGLKESEQVNLFVVNEEMQKRVTDAIKKKGLSLNKITFFQHDYADVWFRDYGPTFVINKNQLGMVKWMFNAWGNKYESLLKDDDMPEFINMTMKLPYFDAGLVMEGGSLEVNGKGTLLTTTECLLNKNRNPGMSKKEIEQKMKDFLGITNIIWLNKGVEGDDTDAHIDNLARFVTETTVVCPLPDKKDINYKNLKENYDILISAKDQDGKPLKIVTLPSPTVNGYRRRLPASYCNFYIGNKAVLVPVFGIEEDEEAIKILSKYFPDRNIVGIKCNELISGSGAIHCISQQVPKV
ncbi:MAG: agmatine deiminase family protein [Nanoarchaeota archaeon]